MLKLCSERWAKYENLLRKRLRLMTPDDVCTYELLMSVVVSNVLNAGSYKDKWEFNHKNGKIDDGDYQGTLLFLIHEATYQPCEYNYLITYIDYGSCSCCDALEGIVGCGGDEKLTENQVTALMRLSLTLLQNMKAPFADGRSIFKESEFEKSSK